MPNELYSQLISQTSHYLPNEDCELIQRAYEFASRAHDGVVRDSGDPYINHPIQVASILANLKLDVATITAALLHDVVEDTSVTFGDIKKAFGEEVADLVNGVTKLEQIKIKRSLSFLSPIFGDKNQETRFGFWNHLESLRKMLLAMTDDMRVIFIKLADRLHNMQTLDAVRPDKRARIAQETLEIYAPIANRLGMGNFKGQLEDLAFPYVYPAEYKALLDRVKDKLVHKEKIVKKFINILKRNLEENGVKIIDIHGRVKHLYSLWQKLQRYNSDLAKIYDLVAVRVIVDDISDCYQALGLVHNQWNPLFGRIKDYIAMPKPNGYQSLHTTVFGIDSEIIEIQIRTKGMHEHAERGIAAHWHYQGLKHNKKALQQSASASIEWIKDLKSLGKGMANINELKQVLKLDFFSDRIFVFTPEGDVVNLPQGATPVDFAYAIHTDVGNRCSGVKINDQLKGLDTQLKNGDIVEIITSKTSHGPKRDWIKFVKTQKARSKIRQKFRME